MSATSVALAHYRRRAARARALERQAAQLWSGVDRANIAQSWADLMPRLLVVLTAMQQAEAAESDAYVALAMAEQGDEVSPGERIVPESWSGLASDGRPLDTLLMQPVITAKTALQGGRSLAEAMAAGQAALQMIVGTQVSDAGRTADQVAMVTHRSQGYIRMVVGDTCSRCVVLAGRWYRWNAGFDRHPLCDCVGIPAAEDRAGDVRTDPMHYFRSLSHAEQDATFGKAGAQAIRDGADMGQVVNARSGMYSAGGQKLTTSGTTRRGFYGGYRVDDSGRLVRRPRGVRPPPRLMPEQIYKIAGSDRERALSLLRENGYITDQRLAATVKTSAQLAARTVEERTAAAATGEQAWGVVPAGMGRSTGVTLTRAQHLAMKDYQSNFFVAVNGQLRQQMELGPLVSKTVAGLDSAMALSTLPRDVSGWRGISDARALFAGREAGDLTGFEWRELAYSSTTVDERVARSFAIAGDRPVMMRILAPRGTQALRIGDYYDQAEVLLQRGLRFRVVADRGISPTGVRLLDVVVVPG